MKKSNSLKVKLSIPIISIIIIVFMLSSFVIIQRESELVKDTIILNAKTFSKITAADIISNYRQYYDSGFFKFKELTENLMEVNDDILKIQMYHVNGSLLFDSDDIRNGTIEQSDHSQKSTIDEILIDRIEKISPSYIGLDGKSTTFEIIQPYVDEWGRHEYSIRYIFSYIRLLQLQQEMVLIVSLYSALFLVISFFSIYTLLNRYVTRPVKTLIVGVRKIQHGNLGEEIHIKSNDELGELATSFNRMTVDLKRSNTQLEKYSKDLEKLVEQKNQLIIQLSHDLKNPLGPITNLISVLKNSETDNSKKEMFEVLQRNAEYMKNLVIKTIEYTKVNSSELPLYLQKVSLIDSFEKIIATKKTLIQKKNLTVKLDIKEDISVFADTLYLEELITNIIENAIIYNINHGAIYISAERIDEFIQITITDTGIGIESKNISKVFDEFYKVDEARHDFESTGLGLSIAKKIVELHKGKISIESDGKNKGTTVRFSIRSIE